MYEVKIYNTINWINKKCWDKLAEDKIFLCFGWLKTFKEAPTYIFYKQDYGWRNILIRLWFAVHKFRVERKASFAKEMGDN